MADRGIVAGSAERGGGGGVALLMVFAALWGVAQLTVLASWSRTLRFSTLVLVVAMGAYGCGVLALLVQLAWTRVVGAATHQPLGEVVVTAGYTVDPVVEEVVKILPLVVLGVGLQRVARQLGLADHLLVGAATGAGFALFEAVLRYGTVSRLAVDYQGGYLVNASLGGAVVVPGVGTSLRTWLPDPGQVHELLATNAPVACMHLAWSALAGLGVGWLLRRADDLRYWGVLPLVYACADHVHYNRTAAVGPLTGAWSALEVLLTWLHQRLGVLVFLAVVAGVAVDRMVLSRARVRRPEVLLGGERPDGLWPLPLLARATTAPPWTTMVVSRFVLARRSTLYALARDRTATDGVVLAADVRGRLERTGARAAWPPGLAPLRPTRHGVVRLMTGTLLRCRLTSWPTVPWLLLLLPPLAYYVLGGFPTTRGIQQALTSPVGSRVILVLAAVGLLWTGWQVWALLSARRSAVGQESGEAVARYLVRVVTGMGALGAGVVLVVIGLRATEEERVVTNLHALDALGSLLVVAGLLLLLWVLFMFPPLAAADGAVGVTTAPSGLLGSVGVVLDHAARSADVGAASAKTRR